MKQAVLRPQAEADLVTAARHYSQQGGPALAERLFEAAIAALEAVEDMPALGSPRLGQWCGISGLRSWRVTGYPLQWLYLEAPAHLDVIRLLGDRQDIPALLAQET